MSELNLLNEDLQLWFPILAVHGNQKKVRKDKDIRRWALPQDNWIQVLGTTALALI